MHHKFPADQCVSLVPAYHIYGNISKVSHLNVGGATICILDIGCCAVVRYIDRAMFMLAKYGTLVYN